MIVKRFKLDDMKDITCAEDFYRVCGYDPDEFANKDVFGNKAYYKNFVMHPETDGKVRELMQANAGKLVKKCGSKTRAKVAMSFDWCNFGPVTCGPRYDEVEEACGRIIRNALYIIQPTDIIYEEAPNV